MRAAAASLIPAYMFPAFALCLAIGHGGCRTFSVRTDYDHEADFAKLRSFAWVEPLDRAETSPFVNNDLLRRRVRQAVARVLGSKGYREVEAADADFLVTFHVTIENRVHTHNSYGYPYYHGGWGGGSSYTTSLKEGTLILDLMLAGERRLIWRGWRNNAVPTPDTEGPKIQTAVEKILDRFPPGI